MHIYHEEVIGCAESKKLQSVGMDIIIAFIRDLKTICYVFPNSSCDVVGVENCILICGVLTVSILYYKTSNNRDRGLRVLVDLRAEGKALIIRETIKQHPFLDLIVLISNDSMEVATKTVSTKVA
nr:hypothetical transcript [Hymenolepis microstoma]